VVAVVIGAEPKIDLISNRISHGGPKLDLL
jgi:hypothetical protein